MAPTIPTLAQSLIFIGFAGISFMALRYALREFASRGLAMAAPPALTVAAIIAAYLFYRLHLATMFVWYMIFLIFAIVYWRRKSRPNDERLAELAEQEADRTQATETDVLQTYLLTRKLLTMGLVVYAAAFFAVFFLLSHQG